VLTFYGGLYGLHGKVLRDRVEMLIEQCELGPHRKTEYNALSTGLKQRLASPRRSSTNPRCSFSTSRPSASTPDISIRLRAQIAALRRERGTTIILTTHYMREAEELCDRIAFIKAGASWPRARPTSSSARSASGTSSPSASSRERPRASPTFPGVLQLHVKSDHIECTVDSSEKRLAEILRWLHEQGVLVRDCQVREPELEEVFVEFAR